MPYRFGRLPGQVPVGLRELPFYAAGRLPKAPAKIAVPSVADWNMDGNDEYGDCGAASLNHGLMATAADLREAESFPLPSEVVSYYLTYTGGQDSGVVLSQFLAYVRQNGFCGHSVAAYAPVAVHDVNTLRFAVAAYDFAYTGITVTQAMMDAFDAGEPWTADLTHGEPLGGHAVPLVGYDDSWLYAVTWGAVQRISYPAWHSMSDEAWAVLSGEITARGTDGHGLSLAALQADLNRLRR